MNQDNFQYLSNDVLPKLGFSDQVITDTLEQKMKAAAKKDFSFGIKTNDKDKAEFEFKFVYNEDKERHYLNSITASITNDKGKEVSQNFGLFFQNGFNDREMVNLLKGRSVYTHLKKDGKLEFYWAKIDFSRPSDENGRHRERREYDNSDKFDLSEQISKFKLNDLDQKTKDSLMRRLRTGERVQIRINFQGERQMVLVEAAPHDGKMRIFNEKGVELTTKEKSKIEAIDESKKIQAIMENGGQAQASGRTVKPK